MAHGAGREMRRINHPKLRAALTDAASMRRRKPKSNGTNVVDLLVDSGNLPNVAFAVRDVLAASGRLFDRGLPVRLVTPADGGVPAASPLNGEGVVIEAHRLCRPVRMTKDGDLVPVTLSTRVANMYLALAGEWMLPPLSGISTAPVLTGDGGVRAADGYDTATCLWCVGSALPDVSERPS